MSIHALGPLHAVGLVGTNEPVTVASIVGPVVGSIFETIKAGANHVLDKSTFSKIAKVVALVGATHAVSSIPGADAGALCFYLCMPTCLSLTGGAFPPACVAACVTTCGWHPV